jgi:hypothetical protein
MKSITFFRAFVLLGAAFWSSHASAHPKTDVVVLTNGDRLTCEIKSLARGRLTIKTDAFGTVGVKWDHVARVESGYVYRLELQSGVHYIGTIEASQEDGKIVVEAAQGSTRVDIDRIVNATPLESSFFDRLKGSVDAGYDFTQASTATTWSLSANAAYTVEDYIAKADFSSNVKAQEGAETTNRQNLNLSYLRHIRNRWFWMGLGQLETSQNLDLDFRGLGGAAIGRRLVQSNRNLVSLLGGAVFTREKFTDRPDFDSNAEAVGAVDFQTFKFSSPELDISGRAAVFPSLTSPGRVRIQATGRAKIEIVKNLYWSLNVYDNYDSAPPSGTDRRNDFGVNSSLGWTF